MEEGVRLAAERDKLQRMLERLVEAEDKKVVVGRRLSEQINATWRSGRKS